MAVDAAAITAPSGGGHLPTEHFVQQPADGVAVEVTVVAHGVPPEGPNRSVLTLPGSWPRSVRGRCRLDQPGGAAHEAQRVVGWRRRRPRTAADGRCGHGWSTSVVGTWSACGSPRHRAWTRPSRALLAADHAIPAARGQQQPYGDFALERALNRTMAISGTRPLPRHEEQGSA